MITSRIFHWATHTPQKTAIIYNGNPFSYLEFAEWIAKARRHFSKKGLVGNGYVVLAVNSLLDFWILSLALRSLGLTTIAVSPTTNIGLLCLPNIRGVVTTPLDNWAGLDEMCLTLGLPLFKASLDHDTALWLDGLSTTHQPGGHILLTSGTTGSYKMVMMSPEFDTVMIRRKVEVFELNQDSVQCVFDFPAWSIIGYGFSASVWSAGGASVIEQSVAPYAALLRPGITHAALIPDKLAAILSAPDGAFPRNDAMQLAVGGGTMTRTQVEQTKARVTVRLYNSLGSTEACGVALTLLETAEDLRWHRIRSNRIVEVVDDFDCPVPAGQLGRIRIYADGGPTSYLYNDPATQEFFKDGYFYPGDLAIVRSDGRFALQGRLTDVINIRGAKVSPAPIEDRWCELLGVSGICLFSMQNPAGEEELHAVIESPTAIHLEQLRTTLAEEFARLPFVHVYFVKALARNQMGKVMRQAVRSQLVSLSMPE